MVSVSRASHPRTRTAALPPCPEVTDNVGYWDFRRVRTTTLDDRLTNYRRADEDVEVQVDDTWHPGHLRAWDQRDGDWWGSVMWSSGTSENRLDWFPADNIRPV